MQRLLCKLARPRFITSVACLCFYYHDVKPKYPRMLPKALLQKVIRQTERTVQMTIQRCVNGNPYLSLQRCVAREKTLRRLGGNVRRECTSRKISQDKLAQLAGINPRTVAKIEAGQLNIRTDTLARISRAIGCSLATLRHGIDESLRTEDT